jgi:MIP family channel proteins
MYGLPKRLIAEFLGTFAFVTACCGAVCLDQYLRSTGQNPIGLLGIAIAQGVALSIFVSAVGHISGGHLNPAVTIGFWVTKRLSTFQSLAYWVAQLLGGMAAGYLLSAIIPESVWRPVSLGVTDLAPDFGRRAGMVLEALMTFFLVFVVFATAVDVKGAFHKVAGFAIGLVVTVDLLVGGAFTGGSMNPARTFGPAIAAHHWQNHAVYWVGPLFGGVLAAAIYDRLFLTDQPPA